MADSSYLGDDQSYEIEHVDDEIEPFQQEDVVEDEAFEEEQEDLDQPVYFAEETQYPMETFVNAYPQGMYLNEGDADTMPVKGIRNVTKKIYRGTLEIFLFVWAMLGVVSFFASLLCFADNGMFEQKLMGFLFSIVMGPLYFLYLFSNQSYCPHVQSGFKKILRMKK
jgi:hypothetical protein